MCFRVSERWSDRGCMCNLVTLFDCRVMETVVAAYSLVVEEPTKTTGSGVIQFVISSTTTFSTPVLCARKDGSFVAELCILLINLTCLWPLLWNNTWLLRCSRPQFLFMMHMLAPPLGPQALFLRHSLCSLILVREEYLGCTSQLKYWQLLTTLFLEKKQCAHQVLSLDKVLKDHLVMITNTLYCSL